MEKTIQFRADSLNFNQQFQTISHQFQFIKQKPNSNYYHSITQLNCCSNIVSPKLIIQMIKDDQTPSQTPSLEKIPMFFNTYARLTTLSFIDRKLLQWEHKMMIKNGEDVVLPSHDIPVEKTLLDDWMVKENKALKFMDSFETKASIFHGALQYKESRKYPYKLFWLYLNIPKRDIFERKIPIAMKNVTCAKIGIVKSPRNELEMCHVVGTKEGVLFMFSFNQHRRVRVRSMKVAAREITWIEFANCNKLFNHRSIVMVMVGSNTIFLINLHLKTVLSQCRYAVPAPRTALKALFHPSHQYIIQGFDDGALMIWKISDLAIKLIQQSNDVGYRRTRRYKIAQNSRPYYDIHKVSPSGMKDFIIVRSVVVVLTGNDKLMMVCFDKYVDNSFMALYNIRLPRFAKMSGEERKEQEMKKTKLQNQILFRNSLVFGESKEEIDEAIRISQQEVAEFEQRMTDNEIAQTQQIQAKEPKQQPQEIKKPAHRNRLVIQLSEDQCEESVKLQGEIKIQQEDEEEGRNQGGMQPKKNKWIEQIEIGSQNESDGPQLNQNLPEISQCSESDSVADRQIGGIVQQSQMKVEANIQQEKQAQQQHELNELGQQNFGQEYPILKTKEQHFNIVLIEQQQIQQLERQQQEIKQNEQTTERLRLQRKEKRRAQKREKALKLQRQKEEEQRDTLFYWRQKCETKEQKWKRIMQFKQSTKTKNRSTLSSFSSSDSQKQQTRYGKIQYAKKANSIFVTTQYNFYQVCVNKALMIRRIRILDMKKGPMDVESFYVAEEGFTTMIGRYETNTLVFTQLEPELLKMPEVEKPEKNNVEY